MKRISYAFPLSHQFRAPFHRRVKAILNERGILYDYIFSRNANDHGKGDTEIIDWATDIPTRTFKFRERTLVWHPIIPQLFRTDLLIIQQENKFLSNYLLIILAKIARRRVAYFGHGRDFQARNSNSLAERWKRYWATKVNWWFAYTEQTADILSSYGFPRDRITVFNNAIDTGAILDERARLDPEKIAHFREHLVLGSQNVAVYVGGLYEEKRIPFLLESARAIRVLVPDFHLIVIGGGPNSHLVESAPEPWIHAMGPKFGADKTELVALAKVWLMPGLVGLAVLDSFAFETPMVTCALPYHSPEFAYLKNGVNGIVLPEASDAAAYASEVSVLLKDETRRLALVEGAAEARATYTIENMARRFADGIEAALLASNEHFK